MDWRRRRDHRGIVYWLRFVLREAEQWSDLMPFIPWALLTGISTLVPLFIMRYMKVAEEKSKFAIPWSPWYERNLPSAYLDDEVDIPRILLWSVSTLEWGKDAPLPLYGERILQSCPVRGDHKTCFVTRERDYLRRADAILFDAHNLSCYDYPLLRHQEQVWVIRTGGEPPLNPSYDLLSMASKFNWTMSYRGDADVTVPYRKWGGEPMGFPNESLNQIISKKSRVAVWLVSKCEADRFAELALVRADEIRNDFEYATFVARSTAARVISDCGGEACKNRHECLKKFENMYFFLLVVESSPCFEHPHQLIFDALQYSLVPVYFGNYTLGRTVPPSSVIDATAAPSAVEVLSLVLYTFLHSERYLDYMMWKENYGITAPRNDLCALCDALYEKRNRTTNGDFVQWWRRGFECKPLLTERVHPLTSGDTLRRDNRCIRETCRL